MKKQFIAKLLVLAMVLAMVPATVLMASAAEEEEVNSQHYYYYSVAADTKVSEIPADGVIEAVVTGNTALVALDSAAAESLAEQVKDGELTLKIEAEGATQIAVSIPAKALVEANADLVIETPVGKVTIPAAELAKRLGEATHVMIVVDANAENVVTVYADWKVVTFKTIKVEEA